MTEVTTAARRIARRVNLNYGTFHVIFFDAEGRWAGAVVGPGDFWPNASEYRYRIAPTLMGPQPQRWTWRMVQDAMDEQDKEREHPEPIENSPVPVQWRNSAMGEQPE